MTEEELEQRLAERKVCEAEHGDLRVPTNGFGWIGTRCSRCGFSFFGEWEDWVVREEAKRIAREEREKLK